MMAIPHWDTVGIGSKLGKQSTSSQAVSLVQPHLAQLHSAWVVCEQLAIVGFSDPLSQQAPRSALQETSPQLAPLFHRRCGPSQFAVRTSSVQVPSNRLQQAPVVSSQPASAPLTQSADRHAQ